MRGFYSGRKVGVYGALTNLHSPSPKLWFLPLRFLLKNGSRNTNIVFAQSLTRKLPLNEISGDR